MAYDDFPDDVSLKFRAHVFFVYAQSTLALAAEIAEEGADNLDEGDLKTIDDLAEQCERIWIEATKVKHRAHG